MNKTAYLSDGTIIQASSQKQLKKAVAETKKYSYEKIKAWFRPCDNWKEAVKKSNDSWARNRGFVDYEAYLFIMNILK